MDNDINNDQSVIEEIGERESESDKKEFEVTYKPEKDFYRGMGGELRFKAEGLFKKAKEKGISIEEISLETLKENEIEFPGIGGIELPVFLIKVKGRHIHSGQVIADGKLVDYFNRYQKYLVEKLESKNLLKDERGKVVKENNKPLLKGEPDLSLSDWEKFEIGKNLVNDKEFGLEKTITGACDRVIRKLMGENDWLYPEEARLLDEEFNTVQKSISREKENKKQTTAVLQRKATDRQINYFKARIKNFGLDPENEQIVKEVLRQAGFEAVSINDLTTVSMSKVIDSISDIIPKIKDELARQGYIPVHDRKSDLN